MRFYKTALLLMCLFMVAPPWADAAPLQLETAVTVSGRITAPGNRPAIGVQVNLNWGSGGASLTTGSSGEYRQAGIPAGAWLNIHVRPPHSMRLAQRNWHTDTLARDLTANFSLEPGYLVSGTVTAPDGSPLSGHGWLAAQPMTFALPANEWLGEDLDYGSGAFALVLPPDSYTLEPDWLPASWYWPRTMVDLRHGDAVGLRVQLSNQWRHPYDFAPPLASRITIGAPDGLGEAAVTGSAGSVLPLAHVLVVNLNSTHQAHTVSGADGAFSLRIFAPPGSALMVKHGPASGRWQDLEVGLSEGVNPFPGTIITVTGAEPIGSSGTPFAAAGAIDYFADDPNTTRNYVSSAWTLTGSVAPVIVEGEWARVMDGRYGGRLTAGLYLGGINWTHPALGDLDSDGRADLLVGERGGGLVLYRNGGGVTPAWQFVTADFADVAASEWLYPALGDLDKDGKLDLVIGDRLGTVAIYYNRGTAGHPAWPAAADAALATSDNAGPALDDLDGDGDLDLLVGHSGGALFFFRNSGGIGQAAWTPVTSNYGGIHEDGGWLQPALVDLNGDGKRDLLIGRCGDLIWYRRGGATASPTWTRMSTDPLNFGGGSCGTSPAVGDWDGDADPDVVTGEHWGALRFFRQRAAVWSEVAVHWPFELAGDTAPALGDWDHDEDLDLLVGQAHGQIHRFTNTGTRAEPDWRPDGILLTLPWTNHPHAYPALADINADGKLDLFVGEGNWDGPDAGGNLRYYRNAGSAASPDWRLETANYLSLDVGGWATPAFVDIDSDNDLDLFVGNAAGTLTYVRNTGTRTAPAWAAPVSNYAGLAFGAYGAPAFLDIDQDRDLDLLVGQEDGTVAYVRNTGTRTAPAWKLVTLEYPGIGTGHRAIPAAADLDGDGRQDLLLGDGDGGLDYYRYLGPGTDTPPPQAWMPGDLLQVAATLRLIGPGITPATPLSGIQVGGQLGLSLLFDAQGHMLPGQNYFMSNRLTPTGFPIQQPERPMLWPGVRFKVTNLHHAGEHAIEGDLLLTGRLPDHMPNGIYRPVLSFEFNGVPASTQWLAANVVHYTYQANEAVLPPMTVGRVAAPHLVARLLMDDFEQGTRGAGAREDRGAFGLASQIVSQGAPLVVPRVDARSGQPIIYRLEPFLPAISFTDRRMPTPPLLPLALPGGELSVRVQRPDGAVLDLGSEQFAQSYNRTRTTRGGQDLNSGTVQMEDVYSLMAASDRFRLAFDRHGHYVITLTGTVQDIWGNPYSISGTYDLWVADTLDIDPGVLPGTPFEVGDAFNPTLRVQPGLPADVALSVTLFPDSDLTQAITRTFSGRANAYGLYSPAGAAFRLTSPGEYRVDVSATYTDGNGVLYMGAMTWGGVVETPNSPLIAHGRRGLDSLTAIPPAWFVSQRDLAIPAGAVSHSLNPYFNGDILWSRMSDGRWGGDSLVLGASMQDTVGQIAAAIRRRAERQQPGLSAPGNLSARFAAGEIPLFSSTRSNLPPALAPDEIDQVAYSYRYSERPGVRVREVVAEDGQSGGYWRLDTLYDDQLGVGVLGDLPNDFKFQYVGTVYRDLAAGINQYNTQGSLWVFIPDDDPLGSRAMPPFAGPGNGGWAQEGGPILRLKGQDIHIFILPTGTPPGAILETGDIFRFAGHIAPTLNSQVSVAVTAPGGAKYQHTGRANKIGYYYDPAGDITVDEPGLWLVDVRVWHDGLCSGGQTVPPYPTGDVLGSEGGWFYFYVVPEGAERLNVVSPRPGYLMIEDAVTPIMITGRTPAAVTGASVDYTISMPGYILEHGQVSVAAGGFQVVFDPAALSQDFPNLDLVGRDDYGPGLADTFTIALLLRGHDGEGKTVISANSITLQGTRVFVTSPFAEWSKGYLPLIRRH